MNSLFTSRRSIRKFTNEPVPEIVLLNALEAARLSPTGNNLQPLRFTAIRTKSLVEAIFPCTKWAGYLEEFTPSKDEQPQAYIAIFVDKSIKVNADVEAGSTGMSIIMSAFNDGYSSCWLGAIDREKIMELLGKDKERFLLHSLIAIGKAAMSSYTKDMDEQGSVRYYIDEKGDFIVPKRSFKEICELC